MRANTAIAVIVGAVLIAAGVNEFTTPDAPGASRELASVQLATPAGEVASLVKEANGHFYAEASVGARQGAQTHVRFLVDTGASIVALTLDDAVRAGVDPQTLDYVAPIQTASGRSFGAPVRLANVRVAGVELDDVDALVIDRGLAQSLLGMSFLGRLSEIETSGDAMILRR